MVGLTWPEYVRSRVSSPVCAFVGVELMLGVVGLTWPECVRSRVSSQVCAFVGVEVGVMLGVMERRLVRSAPQGC